MDVYDLWVDKEAREEAWLRSCPVCCHCRKPIQDENLFNINGELFHEECAEYLFKESTENHIK